MRVLMWHEDQRGPGEGGGAETMLRDLTKGLKGLGHDIAWLHNEHIAQAIDTFKPDIVQIGTVHNRMGWAVTDYLFDNKIPAVWAQMDYYPFCGGRMLLRNWDEGCNAVKDVCDNNCAEHHANPHWMEVVNRFPVLVLNKYSADIYKRNGMRVDHICELGVDTEMFKPDPCERANELQIYTSSAWANYPAKGMKYLLEAVKGTDYKVHLMTGLSREQVALGLKWADIFIFPSTYEETWGLCLNEAMASGCAVIASDVAGPRAQVHAGLGILVPPRDPQAIRWGIEAYLDDKVRLKYSQAAREHVEQEHSLEAMAKRFVEAYRLTIENVV